MRKLQLLLSILLLTAIVTSCTSEAPELLSFLKNYDNSYADFGGREVVIGIAAMGEEHSVLPMEYTEKHIQASSS